MTATAIHEDVTSDDVTAASEPRRHRRLGRLSLTGAVLGLTFGAMSVTPSLVPRAWFLQSLVTGLCVVTGYGLGAFVGWAYRSLRLPDLPDRARSVAWKALGALAVVLLLVGGWLGWRWQSDQRELLGMDTSVPLVWLVAPLLGLLVAALLLGIGRAVKALGRAVFRPLGRLLPVRVAWLLAIVVTVVVTYLVFSGLLIGNLLSAADSIFASNNDDDKPGVVNPQVATRTGGPTSGVTWESIGREGRAFVASGPTASEISAVVGDPAAIEPVRAFVGLEAAAPRARGRSSRSRSC